MLQEGRIFPENYACFHSFIVYVPTKYQACLGAGDLKMHDKIWSHYLMSSEERDHGPRVICNMFKDKLTNRKKKMENHGTG